MMFWIEIDVHDEQELLAAARLKAEEGGLLSDQAGELVLANGEPNAELCLRMLLDPGESPPGASILDSGVDT